MKIVNKKLLITVGIFTVILLLLVIASLFVIKFGYKISVPGEPYVVTSNSTEGITYEEELQFIYDEIRNNYIYLDYKQELFDVGYISIPTFNGNINEIVGEFDKSVKMLKNSKVKSAIIDLRYNTGGNESFREILGYLTNKSLKIDKYRFNMSERFNEIYLLRPLYEDIRSEASPVKPEKGYTKWWSWEVTPNEEQYLTTIPVVVLANERIFSSTSTFVDTCMNFKLGTVIGNSVPLSGCGLSTPIYSPSKKYILKYGFIDSREIDFKHQENVVKEPDIKVIQTLDDYYKGVDSQLNAAIDFITNKTN